MEPIIEVTVGFFIGKGMQAPFGDACREGFPFSAWFGIDGL